MTLTEKVRNTIFEEYVRNNYEKFETAKLPTERHLANQYDVSLVTIRRAIETLEQNNFVRRQQGSGTYVVDKRKLEKQYVIALAVPNAETSPFYTMLAGRIEPKLRRHGHESHLLVVEDAGALLQAFDAKKITPDVVIVCGYLVNHSELVDAGIPYVIAGGEGYQCADNVVFDLRAGAFRAVRHLIEMGHRRILFLSNLDKECELALRINREFVFEMSSRYQGYCDAMRDAKLPIDRSLIVQVGESKRNSYQAILDLTRGKDFDFTAIFASNDVLAEGAVMGLRESGIKVPDQVSLIGCDNLTREDDMLLPLTTLDLRLDDMADAVMRILFDRVKHPVSGDEYISLTLVPQLVRPNATVRKIHANREECLAGV